MGAHPIKFRRQHRNITRTFKRHIDTRPPQEPIELILLLALDDPPAGLQDRDRRRARAQRQFLDDLKPVTTYLQTHDGEILRTSWIGRAIHCRLPAGAGRGLLGVTGVSRIAQAKPEPAIS